jgi:Dullard-like phosphatase family protein
MVVGFAGSHKARSQNESLVKKESSNAKGKLMGHQSFDVEEDRAGAQKRKNVRGIMQRNLEPSKTGQRP